MWTRFSGKHGCKVQSAELMRPVFVEIAVHKIEIFNLSVSISKRLGCVIFTILGTLLQQKLLCYMPIAFIVPSPSFVSYVVIWD